MSLSKSHGYDLGNFVAVLVLELALVWSAHGSLRGRLIAVGALACLLYGFVTYALVIVLNPVTLLHLAVLAFGGWSFVAGVARVDKVEVERLVEGRLARRTNNLLDEQPAVRRLQLRRSRVAAAPD